MTDKEKEFLDILNLLLDGTNEKRNSLNDKKVEEHIRAYWIAASVNIEAIIKEYKDFFIDNQQNN